MIGKRARDHGFRGFIFDMGVSVFTDYDADGHLRAQPDAYGEDESGVDPYEAHHSFGFASRPRDPERDKEGQPIAGKGCNLLIATEGNATHAWFQADPRYVPLIPILKKGGSVQYGATGTFASIDGEDGTWTLYVPYPNGTKAHVITSGVDGAGAPYLGIEHGDGMAVTMLDGKVQLKNKDGSAYVELDTTTFNVNANTKINGALIVGDVVAAMPLAMLPELVTVLQALIVKINAALAAKAPAPGVLQVPVPPLSPAEILAMATVYIKGK